MTSHNKILSTTPIVVEPMQYRVIDNDQGLDPYTGKSLVRTGIRLTIGLLVVHISQDAAEELRYALFKACTRYQTSSVAPTHGLPDPTGEEFQNLRIEPA